MYDEFHEFLDQWCIHSNLMEIAQGRDETVAAMAKKFDLTTEQASVKFHGWYNERVDFIVFSGRTLS
jgi:hypothetical protein